MIDKEQQTTCPRHPNVETALRCASCGVLICPKCLVQTPVGAKCRDCASQQGAVLFSPSGGQAAAAVLLALFAGALAGWALNLRIGFFVLFLAFVYGRFVGELVLKVSSRKRGTRMEILTGVSLAVGVLIERFATGSAAFAAAGGGLSFHIFWQSVVGLLLPSPVPLSAVGIVIAGAVARIRYL